MNNTLCVKTDSNSDLLSDQMNGDGGSVNHTFMDQRHQDD